METVLNKDLSQRLAKRLANFKVKDDVIAKLASGLIVEGLDMKRFDICAYGICVDYFTGKLPRLENILSNRDIAHLEIFPYGIINPDYFQVRVAYNVDELQRGAQH